MTMPEPSAAPRRSPRRLVAAALLLLLVGGGLAYLAMVEYRPPSGHTGQAVIAAVYPQGEGVSFMNGINLAVEKVNREGGINGLPLTLQAFAEEEFSDAAELEHVVSSSMRVAETIARDRSIFAVAGHGASSTAVPASAIYTLSGKPFISTHATATSLTNHAFGQIFSLQPNNYANAAMMAHYALGEGLKRFIVLSDRSDYSTEVAKMFTTFATQGGGSILYRGTLSPFHQSMDKLLLFLLDNDAFDIRSADGIFVVSSSHSELAQFIARARRFGITQPILGPEILYSEAIEQQAGSGSMKEVWAVSTYDRESTAAATTEFRLAYRARYGSSPDLLAAVGYDAIGLLDYVADRAGSLNGELLADQLRVMRLDGPYVGATGRISFAATGMLVDTDAYIVRHDGTGFHTAARYRQPIIWGEEALSEQPANLQPLPRSMKE